MRKFVSDWSIRKMFVVLALCVFLSILMPILYLVYWSGAQIESKKADLDAYYMLSKRLNEISIQVAQTETNIRSWVLFSDNTYLVDLQQIWNNKLLKNIEYLASNSAWIDIQMQASEQVIINDLKNLHELHTKNGKINEKANGISHPIPDSKEAKDMMNASQVPLFEEVNNNLSQLIKSVDSQNAKLSNELNQIIKTQYIHALWLMLLSLLINGVLFNIVFFRNIKSSLRHILDFAGGLDKGIKTNVLAQNQSELGKLAALLNGFARQNNEKTLLAQALIEGKKIDQIGSTTDKDALFQALYGLNKKMEDIATQENKRDWQNQAITRFADLFRNHTNSDTGILADVFLKNISETLQANQAALYLLPDSDSADKADYLEMKACYAWSRKKYLNSRHDIGEGMLGQCFLEKQSYYLENLPESFEFIKSGLGKGKPTCILLCPVIAQESILGVLEIASLFAIEPYQREFAEKIASDLGATLISLNSYSQTQLLLNDARNMSEQMRAQEEIMQQSMEELMATQEDAQRQIAEYEMQIRELREAQKVSLQ